MPIEICITSKKCKC